MFRKESLKPMLSYAAAFVRWTLLALAVGAVCGLAGSLFRICIRFAAGSFSANPWLLYLLPAGGLLIVWLYRLGRQPAALGVDRLFGSIFTRSDVPAAMAPLIFCGTFLTHLFGGSAGREGAALQLGGSLGYDIGRLLRLSDGEKRTMTLIGMGALFSSLFGTPLTASFFVMEVLALGGFSYSVLYPCVTAAIGAYGVSLLLHMEPEAYALASVPALSVGSLLRTGILSVLCAALSIGFCETMHASGRAMKRLFKNEYLRAAAAGTAIVLLTLLAGTRDYNGAGGEVIRRATEGIARPQDFAWKLLFTAITLSGGFKGGEIVPTFFVGAAFGCTVGPLLGLDPGFAAAIGMVALFCGNTNCPVASVFLSLELFGGKGLLLFGFSCAVSYMLSGKFSLYHSQKVLYGSLKLGDLIIPEGEVQDTL